MTNAKCFDPECYQSKIIVFNITRRQVFQHVRTKDKEKLIKILEPYNVVSDITALSDWTLYNLFTDMCFIDRQNKLLRKKVVENE